MTNLWGAYAIIEGVQHHLERKPEYHFLIRPLTHRDQLKIDKEVQALSYFDLEADRMVYPTNPQVALIEVATAYGGGNIPWIKEKVVDGKLVQEAFDPPAPVSDLEVIKEYIGDLPFPVVEELWVAVGKANPTIGPKLQRELAEKLIKTARLLKSHLEASDDTQVKEALENLEDILT